MAGLTLIFASLGVTAAIVAAQPQGSYRGAGMSSGTMPLSPAVIGTLLTSADASGTAQIDLLVLWRGTPGWFTRGSGGGASSSGGSVGPGGGRGTEVHHIFKGGVKLTLEFDGDKRTARIQEREIDLRDDNVVLMDDVDGAGGPTFVGTRRIEPAFPQGLKDLRTLLKRSPELVAYLRCDARLDDARMQQMMDFICASYREP